MAARLSFGLCALLCFALFHAPSCGPASSTETTTDASISDATPTEKVPSPEQREAFSEILPDLLAERPVEARPEPSVEQRPESTPSKDAGSPEVRPESPPETRRIPSLIRSRWLRPYEVMDFLIDQDGQAFYTHSYGGFGHPQHIVARLNAQGKEAWKKTYEDTDCRRNSKLALYDKDHILLLGAKMLYPWTFDRTCGRSSPRQKTQAYVTKISKKDGKVLWKTSSASAGTYFEFTRATVSPKDGSIFLLGVYDGKLTFGKLSLPTPQQSSQYLDRFLLKLDKTGKVLWLKPFHYSYIYADSQGGFFAEFDHRLKPVCHYKADGQQDWCINGHIDFARSSHFAYRLSAADPNGKHVYIMRHTLSDISIAGKSIKQGQRFILKLDEAGKAVWVLPFPIKTSWSYWEFTVDRQGRLYQLALSEKFTTPSGKRYTPPTKDSLMTLILRVSTQGKWDGIVQVGDKLESTFRYVRASNKGQIYIKGEGYNNDTFGDLRFTHNEKTTKPVPFLWYIESIQWDTP